MAGSESVFPVMTMSEPLKPDDSPKNSELKLEYLVSPSGNSGVYSSP